jgi:transglutaminase-like putative cysteine protease
MDSMQKFLAVSEIVDWQNEDVLAMAKQLATGCVNQAAITKHCFEWVRDHIQHSVDYQRNPVTCKASEVLQYGTGYCYAKSHLLAALLRANGIPTGFCYQRLSINDDGAPYSLHGLNAVYLPDYGWYRIDARGNKKGVNAQFTPPHEQLAFTIQDPHEADLPEVWPEPLPVVVTALQQYSDVQALLHVLPDIELY